MLYFGIPTWNRADFLRVCATAIAEQIAAGDSDTRILISDNASDDHTPEVIAELQEKYPFIDATRMEEHGDFAENLKNVFSKVGGDYCWLFGDDDVITPGALSVILSVISEGRFDFIHCCDAARVSGEPKLVLGTLFDLCNQLGWLEVTGFLSSCVVRTPYLSKVTESATWPLYRQNAYPHACHFLETMAHGAAVVIDAPMVTLQSPKQTDETLQRWRSENIGSRYFLVTHALPLLVATGAMPAKVNVLFFRYHKYFMWNKFATSIMYDCYNNGTTFPDDMWQHVSVFTEYLDDPFLAKSIREEIGICKAACHAYQSSRLLANLAGHHLHDLFNHANRNPLTYALTAP